MNYEATIGIVSGIVTIATAAIGVVKLYKPVSAAKLFVQLTDKKLTDKQHKAALKRLNSTKLLNKRISQDYINGFSLSGRGKETILFDICDKNNIEPTDDICKGLIGSSMPSLKKRYLDKRTTSNNIDMNGNIIENKNSKAGNKAEQTLYMSELLKEKFPNTCSDLQTILDKHNVKYAFLKGTKDIWCRDYMPVQTPSGRFVQFRYEPSYLMEKPEYEELRSDTREVCRLNNIKAEFSDINLDGGNVLMCEGRAIISDRIYKENPGCEKEELVKKLSVLLESEIIIIPSEKDDMTGHADGMVRFLDRNTIIGNRLADEFIYWQKGMKNVIDQYKFNYIDMPFFVDKSNALSAIGIYVNYLEVNNLIVMPVFGTAEDEEALAIIKKSFPGKEIETIDYNEVAKEGGLLNCTTWVINLD